MSTTYFLLPPAYLLLAVRAAGGNLQERPHGTDHQGHSSADDVGRYSDGTHGGDGASFGEMDDCADPILVGFLDLAGFGYSIREDDDGHIWVTIEKLGVTCLVER